MKTYAKNHSAFTLIELLFVIVIFGIIGSMTLEIVRQYYENIYKTGEYTKRVALANQTLEQIAKYFEHGMAASTVKLDKNIAPTSNYTCDGAPDNDDVNEYTYAFVAVDFDGLRGYWNGTVYRPTWTPNVTPVAGTSVTLAQDANYTQSLAPSLTDANDGATIYDITQNNNNDVCNNFRWNTAATSAFYNNITVANDTNLTLSTPVNTDKDKYLLRTGYAFRAHNGEFKLYKNFQPWKGEKYTDGNSYLFANKIAHFSIYYDNTQTVENAKYGNVLKLKLCVFGLDENLSDANTTATNEYQICRERSVHVRY